jgi:hypothetical protein
MQESMGRRGDARERRVNIIEQSRHERGRVDLQVWGEESRHRRADVGE